MLLYLCLAFLAHPGRQGSSAHLCQPHPKSPGLCQASASEPQPRGAPWRGGPSPDTSAPCSLQATHRSPFGGSPICKGSLTLYSPPPHALCGFHGNEYKSPSPSQRSLVCFACITLETKSQAQGAPIPPLNPAPTNQMDSPRDGWGRCAPPSGSQGGES